MSAVLNAEGIEFVKSTIKSTIMELLPELIKEVIPIISAVIKDVTPIILKGTRDAVKEVNAEQFAQHQQQIEPQDTFQNFLRVNKPKLDEILSQRYKSYSTLASMNLRKKLYDESFQKDPVYIPKKYRKDSFYVHDEEELASVTKFEMQRFVSEYEILDNRRKHIITEINKIDEQAKTLIKEVELPPDLEEKALQRWRSSAERDAKKIDNEERRKETSTREAYSKDEIFWKKHQVDRLKNRQLTEQPGAAVDGNSVRDTSEWCKLPEFELVVSAEGGHGGEEVAPSSENQHPKKIELVVVPESGHEGEEMAPSSENEHPKNENPVKPVQPPGQGTTPKTTDLRRSERKSSTSLPKT